MLRTRRLPRPSGQHQTRRGALDQEVDHSGRVGPCRDCTERTSPISNGVDRSGRRASRGLCDRFGHRLSPRDRAVDWTPPLSPSPRLPRIRGFSGTCDFREHLSQGLLGRRSSPDYFGRTQDVREQRCGGCGQGHYLPPAICISGLVDRSPFDRTWPAYESPDDQLVGLLELQSTIGEPEKEGQSNDSKRVHSRRPEVKEGSGFPRFPRFQGRHQNVTKSVTNLVKCHQSWYLWDGITAGIRWKLPTCGDSCACMACKRSGVQVPYPPLRLRRNRAGERRN